MFKISSLKNEAWLWSSNGTGKDGANSKTPL